MSEVGEFLAAKNTKFAKAYGPRNLKLENPKLTERPNLLFLEAYCDRE